MEQKYARLGLFSVLIQRQHGGHFPAHKIGSVVRAGRACAGSNNSIVPEFSARNILVLVYIHRRAEREQLRTKLHRAELLLFWRCFEVPCHKYRKRASS